MKILIVHESMEHMGGSELQLIILYKELMRNRYDVYFYSSAFDQKMFKDIKLPDDHLIVSKGMFYCHLYKSLIRNNIDIVIARDVRRAYKFFIVCKLLHIPFINQVNQNIQIIPDRFRSLSRLVISSLIRSHTSSLWAVECFISIRLFKHFYAVISQTEDQRKYLQARSTRSVVIRNSHELKDIKKVRDVPRLIVWIANIKKLKNIEAFIQLVECLNRYDVKFVCAGRPSAKAYQTGIESELKKNGISYLGEISYDEVDKLLSQAYLFINTSQSEGFPNTVIQAWLNGTPVVSLHLDPDDLLKKEGIGLHSKNMDQLVNDVRFLLENEDAWENMSQKGRQYAINNFDIKKNISKYIELFDSIE